MNLYAKLTKKLDILILAINSKYHDIANINLGIIKNDIKELQINIKGKYEQ